jgi:putative cardiolipin synthase
LFSRIIEQGVKVRIRTNSLASTDNLYAFGGYLNQRERLLNLGIEMFEFKPHPATQRQLLERYHLLEQEAPIFAINANTMVLDGDTHIIGTFNFDPRSANLNCALGK